MLHRGLKNSARAARRTYKRLLWRGRTLADKVELDRGDIERALYSVGVRNGDVVFVHSALSALGFVVGGPRTVVEAVLAAVGTTGAVLMPAYPFRGRMLDHLKGFPCFDADSDRSYAGAIPEMFRTMADHRSLHPTHSICAWGKDAAWYTNEHHHDDTPFGARSPFQRAYERDALILCIGSDIAHVTLYHVVEDMTEFPKDVYVPETFDVIVRTGGRSMTVSTRAHDPGAATRRIEADPATERYLERTFEAMGVLQRESLGKGEVKLLLAKPVVDLLIWGAHRGFTIYGDLNAWSPKGSGRGDDSGARVG